ncbi:hypothetical protein MMPV_003217 [Pyropia vietnamensis]
MATVAFLGLVCLPASPRGRAGRGGRQAWRRPLLPSPAPVVIVAAADGDGTNPALPPSSSSSAKGFGTPARRGFGRRGRGGGADAHRTGTSAAGAAADNEAATAGGGSGDGDGTLGFVGADKMGIVFTCGVCETRISKSISRSSYEKGVVLIQCPSCEKRHVIADNLGHFSQLTGGKKNVEEMVGEVTRVSTDVYNLEKLLTNDAQQADTAVDVDAFPRSIAKDTGDDDPSSASPAADR